MFKNITLTKIYQFQAFAENTPKSQDKSLFLLKETAILHDSTNSRLCILVRNSSGVSNFIL
jgi:hypothetical protein